MLMMILLLPMLLLLFLPFLASQLVLLSAVVGLTAVAGIPVVVDGPSASATGDSVFFGVPLCSMGFCAAAVDPQMF